MADHIINRKRFTFNTNTGLEIRFPELPSGWVHQFICNTNANGVYKASKK